MSGSSRSGWTLARGVAASLGAVLLLSSYAMLTGGVALLWSDHGDREGGYVWSPDIPAVTDSYAVTSDDVHRAGGGVQWVVDHVVSEVRLEVTPTDPTDVLFVGLARPADAASYLSNVAHRQVGDIAQGGEAWGWLGAGVTTDRPGGLPAVPPGDTDIWLAQSSGVGTRTLSWPPSDGDWIVVVMQADGSAGLDVTVRTGAAAPHLEWIAAGMVAVGLAALVGGARLLRRTLLRVRSASFVGVSGERTAASDDVPAVEGKAVSRR